MLLFLICFKVPKRAHTKKTDLRVIINHTSSCPCLLTAMLRKNHYLAFVLFFYLTDLLAEALASIMKVSPDCNCEAASCDCSQCVILYCAKVPWSSISSGCRRSSRPPLQVRTRRRPYHTANATVSLTDVDQWDLEGKAARPQVRAETVSGKGLRGAADWRGKWSISDHQTLGLVQPPADDFTNSHHSNIPRYIRVKTARPRRAAARSFTNNQMVGTWQGEIETKKTFQKGKVTTVD